MAAADVEREYVVMERAEFEQCIRIKGPTDVDRFACRRGSPSILTADECIVALYQDLSNGAHMCQRRVIQGTNRLKFTVTGRNWERSR